jgi:hypothetical protein
MQTVASASQAAFPTGDLPPADFGPVARGG